MPSLLFKDTCGQDGCHQDHKSEGCHASAQNNKGQLCGFNPEYDKQFKTTSLRLNLLRNYSTNMPWFLSENKKRLELIPRMSVNYRHMWLKMMAIPFYFTYFVIKFLIGQTHEKLVI
jgi:hypothetical protein